MWKHSRKITNRRREREDRVGERKKERDSGKREKGEGDPMERERVSPGHNLCLAIAGAPY